jgi:N-acetylneuraminic acid mutarotase
MIIVIHKFRYCLSTCFFISLFSGVSFTQHWDVLADVPEKLTFPVAVVADGKIHVMGGGAAGGATTKHYQYDPTTNTWTSKADVPYRAQQPAGAANGKSIHFFGGGFPNSGTPLKHHYIYNTETDQWKQAADLTQARAIHYGVSLNGLVYSLAGQGVANWCEVYDESKNSWQRKNNLPDTRFWYGAHVVTHGGIYRFCGGGYTAPVNDAHRYDPLSDTWSALSKAPVAIHGLAGAAVGEKIYLVGGYHDFEDSKEVWIYDLNSNSYQPGVALPVGRTYHNVLALKDCIYSIGGNNAIDPNVGVSLLRFCPDQTTATHAPDIVSKPEMLITETEILITFPQRESRLWNIQVVSVDGKIRYSFKNHSDAGDHHILRSMFQSSAFYVIRLQSRDMQFHYSVLLLN